MMTSSLFKGRKRTCVKGFVGVQAGLILLYIGLFAQPWSKDKTNKGSPVTKSKDFINNEGANQISQVFATASRLTSGPTVQENTDQLRRNTTHWPQLRLKDSEIQTSRVDANVDPEYTKIISIVNSASVNDKFTVANNLAEWFPVPGSNQTSSLTIRGLKTELGDLFSTWYIKSPSNDSHLCCRTGLASTCIPENDTTLCRCRAGWIGEHCSIPDMVSFALAENDLKRVNLRKDSRKIVNAIAFNMEFDLLEARLDELGDMVDVFVIYESNYTLFGQSKPLRLLERLSTGYLEKFQHKIYYLFLGTFPKDTKKDGWFAEEYERMYIGRQGMKHILGLKPDDLFIYTDADEIPSREALLFLKTHDGYPEPFGFSLRWSVYGFFWKQNSMTDITAGCSIRMFRYIYSNNAQKLRVGDYENTQSEILKTYLAGGGTLHRWNLMGFGVTNAGWHCSWCLQPDLIRIKLISAINADFPRWGSYPEKLDLNYISRLIKSGTWFDDVTKFGSHVTNQTDRHYTLNFFIRNWNKYKYILDLGSTK